MKIMGFGSQNWDFSAALANSNRFKGLFLKSRSIISPADHPAGLAVHRPVSGEAAGGDHRSYHQGLQHSPADPQLHQGGHRRQGERPAAEDEASGAGQRLTLVWLFASAGREGGRREGAHRARQETGHAGSVSEVKRRVGRSVPSSLPLTSWIRGRRNIKGVLT